MDSGRQTELHRGRTAGRAELLAPAGSFESLRAAVAAGADAVYLGGSRFGARAYAENLDADQLLEAIDYAHLHGVALYLTVNTLVKEGELAGLYDYLAPCYARGLDAVIVQDLGVLAAVRRWFPDMHIHASTQMTVTGAAGASLLKQMGATRVVTARELSLEELRSIHEEVDIELESFVHGALCYCYSGQCLLSSLIGGRSGNRGRCAQPCRLPYEAAEACLRTENAGRASLSSGSHGNFSGAAGAGKQGRGEKKYRNSPDERYLMSMKDLCTLDILPDILESGVYSLKIEGRMKSPRYTAGVVSIYRKYVDRYLTDGRDGYRVEAADRQLLLDLFDRGGQTEGYYRQHNGKDMLALKEKPEFRETNRELLEYLDRTYVEAEVKEKICGRLTARQGEPLKLQLSFRERPDGPIAEAAGPVVAAAQNQPVQAERMKRQTEKTGGTPFVFEELEIITDGNSFVPVQALNELRRKGLEKLKEAVLRPYRRSMRDMAELRENQQSWQNQQLRQNREPSSAAFRRPRLHALVSDRMQLAAVLDEPDIAEIQIEADALPRTEWRTAAARCHEAGKSCVLAMPVICRTEAVTVFTRRRKELCGAGFDGFLVRSMEEVSLLKRLYPENGGALPPLFADHHLYVFNHLAAETLAGLGYARLTYPLELNAREMQELTEALQTAREAACDQGWEAAPAGGSGPDGDTEVRAADGYSGSREPEFELTAYGFLPVMTTAQCIRRTVSGCDRTPGFLTIKDRTGKELPVYNHCAFCYNTIYNPMPLALLGMEDTVRRIRPAALRLAFLKETPEEVSAVVRAYGDAFLRGGEGRLPAAISASFTRGHMKRGVE